MGCVLTQNQNVISFASGKLKPHEQSYPTDDLELVAVVVAREKKKKKKVEKSWDRRGYLGGGKEYPELFVNQGEKFRGRNSFKGERV